MGFMLTVYIPLCMQYVPFRFAVFGPLAPLGGLCCAVYRSLYCFCLFCPLHFLPQTLGERLQRFWWVQHLAVAVLRISSFDRGFLHHESHFRHTMRVSIPPVRRHDDESSDYD